MKNLKGNKRLTFFYNQGIAYGAQGNVHISYYKEVDVAFDHLRNFKPFRPMEIGTGEGNADFKMFELGFNKSKAQVIKIQKMKLVAEATCKEIMAEFERGNFVDVNHYTGLTNLTGEV